jgi:hypothetical protein
MKLHTMVTADCWDENLQVLLVMIQTVVVEVVAV